VNKGRFLMIQNNEYDLLVRNARVVRSQKTSLDLLDIGIKDGKFKTLSPRIAIDKASRIVDARNQLAFPGVVDAHMHTGIYSPLSVDARSESRAAAMGGVTTSLSYMRTGQYYLNKGGPYRDFFPEVLNLSEGNFFVDYAYHLAPMNSEHVDEMDSLVNDFGVSSFKIFMFYGGHGLHGKAGDQNKFLMIGPDEKYDYAHFEFVMRGLERVMKNNPDKRDHLSLSLHCETAEIMAAYSKIVENDPSLSGLRAYSASRPQHSEGLAICIASYLAHETNCANINLLHLSSRKAVESALTMQAAFPHINFKKEVSLGHLLLDVDCPNGAHAKVNPPIRPREDVEYLWGALLDRSLDWVVSDHACCSKEIKTNSQYPDDIFLAKSGFGGTEYLLPGLITEGTRRGMSYNHMAEVLCANPAERYGLLTKGDIAPGLDADLVLVDPNKSHVIDNVTDSASTQGYSPFDGMELSATVNTTFLRGKIIYNEGKLLGSPRGRYIQRPSTPGVR